MESQDLPPRAKSRVAKWQNGSFLAFARLHPWFGGTDHYFLTGGRGKVENFHMQIYFFYMDAAPAANDFFVCVSVFLQTL